MSKTFLPVHRPQTEAVHAAQIQKISATETRTLWIGDSVFERLEWFLLEPQQKVLPSHVALLAKGGDKIEHLIWRLMHTLGGNFITRVVFQIGTNNLTKKSNPEEIASGIAQVYQKIRVLVPEPATITFLPLYLRKDIPSYIIHTINTMVEQDFHIPTLTHFWDGILDTSEWQESEYVDHVHLNLEKYNLFFEKLVSLENDKPNHD